MSKSNRYKPLKTIAVFNSSNKYLNHCSWQRASTLINKGKAVRVDATTIKLNEMKQIRKRKMKKIIEKEQRICYICGKHIEENDVATIDHVIPKSKSQYADVYKNMKCCCERCNADKGNKMPIDYIKHIINNRNDYWYLSNERIEYLSKWFQDYEDIFYSNKITKEELDSDRVCSLTLPY